MNAVGIDVSKGKSTDAIRRPGGMVILAPQNYYHTQSSINELITIIKSLEGETKVCMEHTGRYYEPVASWLSSAGIFVSAVNPALIKEFGNESIRTPKTDKADAKKIARFALDRWTKLRQYSRKFLRFFFNSLLTFSLQTIQKNYVEFHNLNPMAIQSKVCVHSLCSNKYCPDDRPALSTRCTYNFS